MEKRTSQSDTHSKELHCKIRKLCVDENKHASSVGAEVDDAGSEKVQLKVER